MSSTHLIVLMQEHSTFLALYPYPLSPDEGTGKPSVSVSLEVRFVAKCISSIVFIKRGAVLTIDRPIAEQVLLVNFPEGSPFDTLHTYVHNAVSPYLNSFISSQKVSLPQHPAPAQKC